MLIYRVLMDLLDWLWFVPSLPRRWDGMNLSDKGTIRTRLRLISGTQKGVPKHWSTYSTAISDRHLWADRTSIFIAAINRSALRHPTGREGLAGDFIVVPVVTASGAELEWAFRESQLDGVIALLGAVAVG